MPTLNEFLEKALKGVELNERTEKNKKILKAKIQGIKDGQTLSQPYRAVMFQGNDGRWQFAIEQSFDGKYTEHSGLPAWSLSDLLGNSSDTIMIDAGQKWGVKGMKAALKEAMKNI